MQTFLNLQKQFCISRKSDVNLSAVVRRQKSGSRKRRKGRNARRRRNVGHVRRNSDGRRRYLLVCDFIMLLPLIRETIMAFIHKCRSLICIHT